MNAETQNTATNEAADAASKAADKAAKAEAKAAEKAAAAAAKAEAKAAKEATKAAAAQAKADEKAAKAAEKEALKATREATKQPEQNGIRRPKAEGLCGRAWAIFDEVSAKNGSPASITESIALGNEQGLNPSNVRAEYARWRKFHGISGRIAAPKEPEATATEAAQ